MNIGVNYVGFISPKDRTYLNINGELIIDGNYTIGRGCRFDIGENAVVEIGTGGYINANIKIIIMNGLSRGVNCSISWDCQFLNEDFHTISYEGKLEKSNKIIIGNNVWIVFGVKIYKGTHIPNGCSAKVLRKMIIEVV